MIIFSTDFETAMKAPVKTLRVIAYNYAPDAPETTTEVWADDLQSMSLNAIGTFLGASSKKITATVVGDQSPLLNSGISIDVAVKLIDGDWESIHGGQFIVYQVDYNIDDNISTVTLYDPMMMLSTISYGLSDDLFPMTVQELAQTVCALVSITLDTDFNLLPNYDTSITENLWKTIQNTSYRDVIQQIAEATGTTAVVSGGTLVFKQVASSVYSIDDTNLVKFKLGQKWGNVNSVSLSRLPQNDNILLRNDDDVTANGLYEITIINNQIVDDDRTGYIQPLYDALVDDAPYINYYSSEFTTEGHGWYEVGDLITATLSGIDYNVFITEVVLTIDGGISEVIKSVIPTDPAVNKTTAGGIIRSLWNTEIKVDKQNNDILSVVSRQDDYEASTQENFTEVLQSISDITTTIQDGGGMNQIKNSVGYAAFDGEVQPWTITSLTAIADTDNTSAFAAGAISGSNIDLTAGAGTFTQQVTVIPGGSYVISFYARKEMQGVVTVSASNDIDNFSVTFNDDTAYDWAKYRINDIIPTSNYLDITFTLDADVSLFSFTDLIMVRGIADKGWSQAVGEVANTNVTLDINGITVKSSVNTNAKTVMTPLEFAGYNGTTRVFSVNGDTTEVNKLSVVIAPEDVRPDGGDIQTPTIDIFFLTTGPSAGMNFVVKG